MTVKLRVAPATIAHLEEIRLSEDDKVFYGENWKDSFATLIAVGGGFAVFYAEQIIALFGNIALWQGVHQLWLLPSRFLEGRAAFAFARFLKEFFLSSVQAGIGHRYQTETRTAPKFCRLMEFLGFKIEGRMSKYYPNQADALLWAYVEGA